MKLHFFNRPAPQATRLVSPNVLGETESRQVELVLSPHHPVLDVTKTEIDEQQRTTEVLHVRIQREDGKVSHLHFSVGLNSQGRVFGEIAAMCNEPHKQVVRKATAGWREPVSRSGQ